MNISPHWGSTELVPRSLWTGGAQARPVLKSFREVVVTHRRQRAPFAGIPTPHHQFVGSYMLDDLCNRLPVIQFRIFNLTTNLSRSPSFPDHRRLRRRQMPAGRTGRHIQTGDILFLMTGAAPLAILAVPIDAPLHVLRMDVAVVALSGKVTVSMTIQTARMFEHGNDRSEEFAGACVVSLAGRQC